jgi:hypothetical protein
VKWRDRAVWEVFGGLAGCATIDISEDKFAHAGPPELTLDEVKSFDTAGMSSYNRVVTEGGNISSEVGVMRDIYFLVVEDKSISDFS